MLPIDFERPIWLLLLLMVIPTFWFAWVGRGGQSNGRLVTSFTIRTIVIVLLTTVLTNPTWVRTSDDVTVTLIMDRSLSVPSRLQRDSLEFVRRATEEGRRDDDRVAVIAVAKDAEINSLASAGTEVDVRVDPADRTATDLAAAIRMALAIIPDDTSNRLVLVSDGNETVDSVLEAAEIARASEIPVDVVPLAYDAEREVIMEELVAPSRGRVGQTARLRAILRSQGETSGTLTMRINDRLIDLSPGEPGDGRRVNLKAGTNPIEQLIGLDRTGPYEFTATFEPDDESQDTVERNNQAVAVTFVGGEGNVLVSDATGGNDAKEILDALGSAGIGADFVAPDDWTGGVSFLGAYDCVVLVNMPIHALSRGTDAMLYSYVHDLGGGLVMVGGDQSFGAGGWIDSRTAETLPVELNPPQTRQMLAGALALIMHSCEMPQGNYWGQLVAESAINALSRLDYCGLVEYQFIPGPNNIQGNGWLHPMQRLGDKKAALAATQQMAMGDMPSFDPSMKLAIQGLTSVNAAQKHCIIISDGDPSPPLPGTMQQFIAAGATVTTVMVSGHGGPSQVASMRRIAEDTGGTFYTVTNPNTLPQIFFKEATMISRSLIQDGQVYPVGIVTGLPGPVSQFRSVPPVEGYVLTEARGGTAQTPLVVSTEEGDDPLYAYWNFGLGRSVAYTSAADGRWGGPWLSWPEFEAFWEKTVRWAMRPSTPTNLEVTTRIEGETGIFEMEATDANADALNFLSTNAVVVGPDAEAQPLEVVQVGPGRYRGTFKVDQTGAYLVNVRHERAGAEGDSLIGTAQAAISVPFSREFRTVASNEALLRTLADRTGGRVIRPQDPALAEFFERDSLPVPRSPKPIWDILAVLAAGIMILDVAARRLTVDPEAIKDRFRSLVGRQAESGGESLDAMRRARGAAGAATASAVVDREVASRRYQADESGGPSLDLESETTTDGTGDVRNVRTRPADIPGDVDDARDADGEYTSRLLQAKRRARNDDAAGGDEGDAGGKG